ncbi:DUF3014 domain-containing protein [Pseudothauera nasutitermitis]|uniref:DUF3014 domain-containing protein n=1 Tax=Pseudothauera nasutitermitis TaxID=2565930 RepID=A0A4S4B1M1_9RHOO|nr:DUF3014 domain-containing protein [Pseudothauera nasutitermitis]THF66461.1 DUF3014 domain-containing protein [Pseudothauera nasutitermitis]
MVKEAKRVTSGRGGWIAALLLVVVAVVGYFLWTGSKEAPPPPVAGVEVPAPPPPPLPDVPAEPGTASGLIEPAPGYPPPQPEPEDDVEPLPALDESDAALQSALAGLPGLGEHLRLLISGNLVRRIVVTVDNLPGERLPIARAPLRQAEGAFRVTAETGAFTIAADNAARYTPYVRLAEAVPAQALVALYARFYPLFQEAYEELGYPSARFNDRLVAVIDHVVAAPEISGPIELVQPKIRYLFADPRLEALSAGQKIMIRMGPENARKIKAKLREIRALLAAGGERPAAD